MAEEKRTKRSKNLKLAKLQKRKNLWRMQIKMKRKNKMMRSYPKTLSLRNQMPPTSTPNSLQPCVKQAKSPSNKKRKIMRIERKKKIKK